MVGAVCLAYAVHAPLTGVLDGVVALGAAYLVYATKHLLRAINAPRSTPTPEPSYATAGSLRPTVCTVTGSSRACSQMA